MSDELLDAVEVRPDSAPKASVIWLHGLGSDGHDFGPIVPELGIGDEAGVRFVFPHAPMRPVTINGGAVMRAWYDIKTPDLERHIDRQDLETSRQQLEAWIEHERGLGIPSEKIVLAGFSQGGAIVLFTGLQFRERLGGIMALSCYHPVPELIQTQGSEEIPWCPFISQRPQWHHSGRTATSPNGTRILCRTACLPTRSPMSRNG